MLTYRTGRVGKDTDIGSAILYLSGKSGTFVNGQILHVDGGQYFLSVILVSSN